MLLDLVDSSVLHLCSSKMMCWIEKIRKTSFQSFTILSIQLGKSHLLSLQKSPQQFSTGKPTTLFAELFILLTHCLYGGTKSQVHPHFSCSSGTDFMRPPESGFVTVQSFHDQTWSASQTSND